MKNHQLNKVYTATLVLTILNNQFIITTVNGTIQTTETIARETNQFIITAVNGTIQITETIPVEIIQSITTKVNGTIQTTETIAGETIQSIITTVNGTIQTTTIPGETILTILMEIELTDLNKDYLQTEIQAIPPITLTPPTTPETHLARIPPPFLPGFNASIKLVTLPDNQTYAAALILNVYYNLIIIKPVY